GSAVMFAANPIATVAICLVKGTAAGYLAGVVAKRLTSRNLTMGVIISAIVAPVCNTGIFCIGMLLFFRDLLASWGEAAGFSNIFIYIFAGLIGINFIVELLIDIVLSPVIIRIISAVKRSR
ncbi:MAG: ECF transporter S component, partial [Lachnospiraceae bacterium]|nr:ECF transporter S component [Lachnospiraceae bacterium]